ncbi:uncharacterized protein J4E79_008162 [Alternaria viburni]|uniref:uncharacterized protein n=1 Tax=Alternaria viburni TaxID=566460 RepID=UPI0020C282E2|nr:uncharacterized protein J4E79_008162 [Alternaria viburni]KAI4655097.1 hypothetical protein J4E79_008162 [Alternaria viburni]
MAESTSFDANAHNGNTDFHSPRPRKPTRIDLLKPQLSDEAFNKNGTLREPGSGISSGRSTPIPDDAPPSVQASSSARRQIRAQHKQRIFPTIDYVDRVSHFDPNSDYHDFRGFFVLFWIGLAIMVITSMLRNMTETGYPFQMRQWALFKEKVVELGLVDGAMVFSTALSLPLQRLFLKQGSLRWNTSGIAIQSIFQAIWLAFWTTYPFIRDWSWTAQVFFTLHLLAIFMKMHSYAFYNGHLSETLRRLNDLDTPDKASKVAAVRYPSSSTHLHEIPQSPSQEEPDPKKANAEYLGQLRDDLALELASPLGNVSYPNNLTLYNFVDFIFCPTLCYELEYPRNTNIRWLEVFYKTLAVFGCIFLMVITAEEFILPVLDVSAVRLQNSKGATDFTLILSETIGRLLFPFMITFLLVFLVIFEYILGAFAEITRFADRQFYADWWNSCDWLEFSREWNKPVHHFFRRHVYSASKNHMSRPLATTITFLISALAHELVMGCITRKFRGYGFVAMMLQMPIVMLQRSKWVRGRTLLNNVLFWCSMILGLSMMCALYIFPSPIFPSDVIMSELHEALACLRPKEFSDVPTDNLSTFLSEILAKAEVIANSVPPPPNGTPYESSQRTRTEQEPATGSKDLTISQVRRPPPAPEHEELQKSWGKPVKLGNNDAATGMSVYKMAGKDRHGAWFSRSSVHEGLGFEKWKRAMKREFPESLEVQGGPGEGNIRGIGGDQRLEDMTVNGVGQLQVYQLSAQFPGPTSPREFITLLITSDTCLTDASKVANSTPRHFMVVSIPCSHPDAPPRSNMVRGFYESIEMIREIPMGDGDAETNPIEWIMVTRSDPGGGIPRFMVERNVPSSIVQDAVKFLDWACAKDDDVEADGIAGKDDSAETPKAHDTGRTFSATDANGMGAGIGTSIVDKTGEAGSQYSLQRTRSDSSSSSSSSGDSFASAEQFTTAREGLPIDREIPTPSTSSQQSLPLTEDSPHHKGLQKIEEKKEQLKAKLEQAREKQESGLQAESQKANADMQKANEKHEREKKKQKEKYEKEMRKLEERREKETRKLLLRQQKEADKNQLAKAQRERDEFKQRVEILEQENKLIKEQIGDLQHENTTLVSRLGKTPEGIEILRSIKEGDKGRLRASSRTSVSSGMSGTRSKASSGSSNTLPRAGTTNF